MDLQVQVQGHRAHSRTTAKHNQTSGVSALHDLHVGAYSHRRSLAQDSGTSLGKFTETEGDEMEAEQKQEGGGAEAAAADADGGDRGGDR